MILSRLHKQSCADNRLAVPLRKVIFKFQQSWDFPFFLFFGGTVVSKYFPVTGPEDMTVLYKRAFVLASKKGLVFLNGLPVLRSVLAV